MVLVRDGQEYPLTIQEADLLGYLARAERTVPRSELLQRVWGYAPTVSSRAVDATVSRLRAKLEPDPSTPQSLISVRGKGYRLEVLPPLAPSSTLFGRDAERHRLRALLHRIGVVQLIGRGGVGKTSLARDLAFDVEVFFVDLSDATTISEATATVARALDLDLSRDASADSWPRIVERLVMRDQTVVLDNLEQLEPGFSSELHVLRERGVPVVVTSRSTVVADWPILDLDGLTGSPARQLLVRAARRVQPAWQGDTATLDAITETVDGLPLALELIGGRLATIPPETLARGGLRVLGFADGRPGRHRTLEQAIRWSWALLDPEDRQPAMAWALLHTGLAPSAIEALTLQAGSSNPAVPLQTLDRLARLGWLDTTHRPPRFWVTIRAFLLEQLRSSGQLEAAQDAFTAWVLAQIPEDADGLDGVDRRELLERLTAIRPDLMAAFELLEARAPADAARIGLALLSIARRMTVEEAQALADRTACAAQTAGDGLLHARTLLAQVHLSRHRRDPPTDERRLAQCRRLLDAHPDAHPTWSWLHKLAGNHARSIGDLPGALERFEAAQECAVAAGLEHRVAELHHELGATLRRLGRLDDARQHLLRSAAAARHLEDPTLECLAFQALASIARVQLSLDAAVELGERAVETGRRADDDYVLGGALTNLANVHLTRTDHARAIPLNREAVQVLRRGGFLSTLTFALGNLGESLIMAGEAVEAELLITEARQVALQANVPYAAAFWRARLAALAHDRGALDVALAGYTVALEELREQEAHPQLEHTSALAAVAAAELGRAALARSYLDDAAPLSRGSAVDQALLQLCEAATCAHLGEPVNEVLKTMDGGLAWAQEQLQLPFALRLYQRATEA